MKTKFTERQGALLIGGLLVLILSGLFFVMVSSQKNKLKQERIRSETLLSERLMLEKKMDAFQKEQAKLQDKHANLLQMMKETSDQLAAKDIELKKLQTVKVLASELKKKNAEMEGLYAKVKSEIDSLVLVMGLLTNEKTQLGDQLEAMIASNDLLNQRNSMLQAMLSDNYRVEAIRGKNNKLTVVARKANSLVSSFDVPVGFGDALFFKVITPEDVEILSSESQAATIRMEDYDGNLMASLSGGSASMGAFSKRAELIYTPEQKLTKGIYQFHVYDGKNYMGCVQVRLK
jgi:hypothetical protein